MSQHLSAGWRSIAGVVSLLVTMLLVTVPLAVAAVPTESEPTAAAGPLAAGQPRGMFELYEDNRRHGIPNYITEDFLALSYLMLLERTVERMEATRMAPAFRRLVESLAVAVDRLPASDRPPAREIRDANRRFLDVIRSLLDEDPRDAGAGGDAAPAPEDPVRAEVELVLAARGEALSPVVAQRLDYSQFRVRGRYTRNAELGRYFRAARYAGSVLFAVVASNATSITAEAADRLTAQALQLSRLIVEQDDVREAWEDLDRQADWWFGPADDLTAEDFVAVAGGSTPEADQGGRRRNARRQNDLPELRRRLFEHARATGRRPRIAGSIVDVDRLEAPLTALDVLTGWRLFPQRYSADSAALGRLVYDRVGSYLGDARPRSLGFAGGRPVKGLPSALELMALLGSRHAGSRLDATDERNFEGYAQAAEEARALLWEAQGLGGDHLALLRFWLAGSAAGGPARRPDVEPDADARQTNTALAFWTYHRYVGLLYSKQSYSGVSKSFSLPPERTKAWLEPAAELYVRLARSAGELAARAGSEPCAAYARILERCISIAVAERAGLELDAGDVDFLNDLDHQLFRLIGRRDTPIVVDVHTDPASRQVVQEGIGWPQVVEKDLGQDLRARGTLFRHHELHQPISERLTDESWSRMLLAGKSPED